MTGIVVLLYVAIGIGCGLIRLSAVAVGVIAMVPAVVGVFAVGGSGAVSIVMAVLVPLLVIEGAYFLTMLLAGKLRAEKSTAPNAETREATTADLGLPRKPQMREEQ
jgi:hypothetical protein